MTLKKLIMEILIIMGWQRIENISSVCVVGTNTEKMGKVNVQVNSRTR